MEEGLRGQGVLILNTVEICMTGVGIGVLCSLTWSCLDLFFLEGNHGFHPLWKAGLRYQSWTGSMVSPSR